MSYSTFTSILTILPGLPQTSTESAYSETVAIISPHITRADSLIDGKIANRYVVPLSTTPALIQTISEDIASYFSYRSLFTQDNQNVSQWLEKFEQAIEWLDEIRKGDMDLVGATEVLPATDNLGAVSSNTKDYTPMFDVDDPYRWSIDQDRLDAIESARE